MIPLHFKRKGQRTTPECRARTACSHRDVRGIVDDATYCARKRRQVVVGCYSGQACGRSQPDSGEADDIRVDHFLGFFLQSIIVEPFVVPGFPQGPTKTKTIKRHGFHPQCACLRGHLHPPQRLRPWDQLPRLRRLSVRIVQSS